MIVESTLSDRPPRTLREVLSSDIDPYDRDFRSQIGDLLYRTVGSMYAPGCAAHCRLLLRLIGQSFPTPVLATAYLESLRLTLRTRPRRASPGRVVLGIGPGRCGSTSLTAMLATAEDTCCTHESPPVVDWTPAAAQVEFHWARFTELIHCHTLTFDAAHWWLNVCDDFFARFPTGRVIGLWRDEETCASSFAAIKGAGRGAVNHWAPAGNGIWRHTHWDPAYPTYPLAAGARGDPDGARLTAIRRYVAEYNDRMRVLREDFPDRVLLVSTEDLREPIVQRQIADFAGVSIVAGDYHLNAATMADGRIACRY